MNVTEQNIMLSSYASGQILSASPKGDIIGKQKRSFPKRGTESPCRESGLLVIRPQ